MSLLGKLIETKEAVVGKPATAEDIERLNTDLRANSLIECPQDMMPFFKAVNGFSCNGILFYGTDSFEHQGFKVPSLSERNTQIAPHKKEWLVLGTVDDLTFIYDKKSGQYAVYEVASLGFDETFETFEDLFHYVVEEYCSDEE